MFKLMFLKMHWLAKETLLEKLILTFRMESQLT